MFSIEKGLKNKIPPKKHLQAGLHDFHIGPAFVEFVNFSNIAFFAVLSPIRLKFTWHILEDVRNIKQEFLHQFKSTEHKVQEKRE